ncbi:LysR family transcriptional regulator [Cupriavidus consociatus]|uniref:LysR family transcriptional regulator n=1 Tax=Cupriavidus consociatus TaxID=2821357 RepID=UPI001AE4FAC8|nr:MULTISPECIES: LysR family transcriptional regulator [unclassified Cupriavidus]MBP0623690.1 LysR family transcriptional regulator [Cupriavidus sp. LEh25]MDK2660394.1 LysR family transcriptional regulator [Cupriavidus sp. LEh21]
MTPFHGKLRARHLEVILSVSDLGNLSRAADQMHMTQSGLSRAVAEVEEIVGGRLFERTAKGMTPTALGTVMCRHADLILSDMRKAEADLAAVASGGAGSLSIGCFSMFAGWPIADAILKFRRAMPGVLISVEVGSHETLIEKLDTGAVDLLISRNPRFLHGETYRTVDLLDDGIALACSVAHPLASAKVTLEDCIGVPWITSPPGSHMRELLLSELRERGLKPPNLIGALSLELGRALMLSNDYLWQLPGSVARHLASRGEVVMLPVSFTLKTGPLSAIWRKDRSSTRVSRAFIVTLRETIHENR